MIFGSCTVFVVRTPPGCRTISGLPGPEDFDVDRSNGTRLIISSQDRRRLNPGGEFLEPGRIFFMKVGGGAATAFQIKGRDDYPFHPHGIHVVRQGSATLLYVVNHALRNQHSIEKFRIQKNQLYFLDRYRSALLTHPNDLVATPQGDIYVTNDRNYMGFLGDLGDLFSLNLSNVVHFSTRTYRFREAASGIAMANGIALDRDRLYVAGTRDEGIRIFYRNSKTGEIGDELGFIDVGSGVDNLLWERPGVLNVAAHPDIFAFVDHIKDSNAHSPSEVYRVHVKDRRVERIFGDTGVNIDASSSAVVVQGRLVISQVFDPQLLICSAP